jgi:4-amino-4-deoxy-L-arabinose transferase-like glycosyltransferase
MAFTPAAVLIFRFNNPDALLTLLLVAAAGAFLRALETGRLRWVVMAAMLVGLAFNTKYLQAYLVLPAFALTYLIAAPGGIRRRVVGLLVAGVTVLASSLWWVAIVELLPTAARPYIGGSSSNSALELLLGYDGLQRIFGFIGDGFAGRAMAGPGPGGGGGGFGGLPGLLRMFNDQFGGQVAWLIPMSLVGLAGGLWLRGRAPRTDTKRAAYLMWGLWLLTHVAVFSLMSGIVHTYYVVVLAPPIGALVGGGIVDLWAAARGRIKARAVLAAGVLGSAGVAWWLLARTPEFVSWLGPAVVVAGVIASLGIAAGASTRSPALVGGLALAVLLAAPAAYAVDTMTTAYAGGDPKAGPATVDRFGGPGGPASDTFRDGGFQGPPTGLGPGAFPGGTRPGDGGFAGGPGRESADSALAAYLLAHKGTATWVAATTSAMSAGVLELATREPVLAMGGFSGSDPAPTLDQVKAYVASGQLRYVLVSGAGGFGGPGGGNSTTAAIDAWVQSVGTAVDYGGGGGTLYDLSRVAP